MMIGAIILAAGSSRRFGSDKRRSKLPSGQMVLEKTILNVSTVIDHVLVVLRSGDREFTQELSELVGKPSVEYFCAPDSAEGMGSSLSNAINMIQTWDAALVFLGDMPFIQAEAVESIIAEFNQRQASGAPIVMPTQDNRWGHPVMFDQAYFEEIKGLTGDQGAKRIIRGHRDMVFEIPVDDGGVLKDIDRPSDISS